MPWTGGDIVINKQSYPLLVVFPEEVSPRPTYEEWLKIIKWEGKELPLASNCFKYITIKE
jgi:hypothetical protein